LRDYIERIRAFDNAEQLIADTAKRQQNSAKGGKGTSTYGSSNHTNTYSKGLCRFFLKGYCKFGDNCTESHQGDMKSLIKRAAKAQGIPAAPALQSMEHQRPDGKKGKKDDGKGKKKCKKDDDKGKSKGKGKKKGNDGNESETSDEGGRRPVIPLAQRPCLNIAFFGKCDNHGLKVCPYGHDQKTQADYKAGKIQGYKVDSWKKKADEMRAKGITQFTLPDALKIQP
jgi:hypothetical protein